MRQDRQRRDDAIRAGHQQALARGEKRVLRTTATGALHSYAGDEIGFTPGRGHVQVSTWWGMGIVTTVLALTNGGPADATTPLTVLMFRTAFNYGEYGYGSSIALLLALMSFVVTLVIFRATRRDLTR